MADRKTMNVSLPPAQEEFVRAQVNSGKYRSASEVVRDGLRLLERDEHRRLLEAWIYGEISDETAMSRLPAALVEKVKAHFKELVDEAMEDVEQGRTVSREELLEILGRRRLTRRSA